MDENEKHFVPEENLGEESPFEKGNYVDETKISPQQLDVSLRAVYEVPVQVSAVLGRTSMPVHQLLKLGRGAIIELDRRVGEPIDIFVNNRLVARGEVVIVENQLGITMTEIVKYGEH